MDLLEQLQALDVDEAGKHIVQSTVDYIAALQQVSDNNHELAMAYKATVDSVSAQLAEAQTQFSAEQAKWVELENNLRADAKSGNDLLQSAKSELEGAQTLLIQAGVALDGQNAKVRELEEQVRTLQQRIADAVVAPAAEE